MIDCTIHTDGGSRGNPGPAAYAYTLERPDHDDIEEKCYLGSTTNNIAEYTGFVKALEHARELGVRRVRVHSDSELLVKQMNGQYKVKNEGLLPLYRQAVRPARRFRHRRDRPHPPRAEQAGRPPVQRGDGPARRGTAARDEGNRGGDAAANASRPSIR